MCPIFRKPKSNTCGENQTPCGPKQYLSVNSICTSCHPTCSVCLNDNSGSILAQSNSLSCLQCDSSLGYENHNSLCVETYNKKNSTGCYHDKYYDPVTESCQSCHASCIGCTGPYEYQCLACIGTKTLSNNICMDSATLSSSSAINCGPNEYKVVSPQISCMGCHVSCLTC